MISTKTTMQYVMFIIAILGCTYSQNLFELKTGEDPILESCADKYPWMNDVENNTLPVIGVLSQTFDFNQVLDAPLDTKWVNKTSYIASSIVKYLQSSGARVVPLIMSETMLDISNKILQLDGIVFPGGKGVYGPNGVLIFNEVKVLNEVGNFYPIWGIDKGMQRMIEYTAAYTGGDKLYEKFGVTNTSLQLEFLNGDPTDSTEMYCRIGAANADFRTSNLAFFNQSLSIQPTTIGLDEHLHDFWNVTATATTLGPDAKDQVKFVASVEANDYPFIGTQFQPEKASQVFLDSKSGINHSWLAVQRNQYFADQFVMMARTNQNTFGNFSTTNKVMISQYPLIQTDQHVGAVYVFE